MINCPFSKKASTRTIIKTYGMCVMCTLMTHWNTIFYHKTFNQNGSLFKSYDIDVGMQCI